jgi:hypothetical protein
LEAVVAVVVERPADAEVKGGGWENCGGGALNRVSVVMTVAVGVGMGPGCGAGGDAVSFACVDVAVDVGARGRAPGWGGGGFADESADAVVVAGA